MSNRILAFPKTPVHPEGAIVRVGDRVELKPHLDDWMRGDRYGVVTKIGRIYVHVKLEKSSRTRRYAFCSVDPV